MQQPNQLAKEINRNASTLRHAGLKVHCSHADSRIELDDGSRRMRLQPARAQALLAQAKALWEKADSVSFENALLHVCLPDSAELRRHGRPPVTLSLIRSCDH
jgi:hypothetical protein